MAPEVAPEVLLEVQEASEVAAARRAVAGLLDEGDPDLVDAVRLTVSEILTNALVHGRPPVELMARCDGQMLRIEVADNSAERGSPQQASATSSGGRGLAIVDSAAHRWGMEARGNGKAVWLEFQLGAGNETVETSVVHLLGVPVDAYLRGQEHLQSTLHELQVLAASDRGTFGTIETSMVMPLRAAMETFGASRRHGRAEAEAAASAGRELVDFSWNLPAEAAGAAQAWAAKLAELEGLAYSGVILTPPPDIEVVRLRQWLADEIAAQLSTGRPPVPFDHRSS